MAAGSAVALTSRVPRPSSPAMLSPQHDRTPSTNAHDWNHLLVRPESPCSALICGVGSIASMPSRVMYPQHATLVSERVAQPEYDRNAISVASSTRGVAG